MKFLIPVVIMILLILTGMHTLLQYMPWESAMRYMGCAISGLAALASVVYLPSESN